MAEAALENVEKKIRKQQTSLRKLANRDAFISSIVFAVLIGGLFIAFNTAKKNIESLSNLSSQQLSLEKFRGSLPNVLLPLNDFTLTGNKEDVPKLKAASQNFRTLYQQTVSLPGLTPTDRKVLQQVEKMMDEVIGIANDIVSGKVPSAMANNVAVVAQSLVFVAQQKLNDVAKHLQAALEQEAAAQKAEANKQAYVTLSVVIFLGLLLFILSRRFVKKVTDAISSVAHDVNQTSSEILMAIEQQTAAADTQAKSIEQIATELEEIAEAAAKIASTSRSVEKVAETTSASANDGVKAVNAAIASMQQIRDEVNTIAEKISFAGQKAEQILESVDLVQEIADETHLLALNASIESAAAGEFGKRFAVVASEVRRLADRTRQFTEEIQEIVNQVHEATKESVDVTEEGLEEVRKGVEIAQKAGDVLLRMQSMTEKTSKAIKSIAQATMRQNESNEDFLRTMQQISSLLQDSAAQMKKSRDASYRLKEVAEDLQRLV